MTDHPSITTTHSPNVEIICEDTSITLLNSFDASYSRYFWDNDFRIDFSVDSSAPSCGYAESYDLIDTATSITEAFAWLEFDSATNEVVLRPGQYTGVSITSDIDVEITMGTFTQAFSV